MGEGFQFFDIILLAMIAAFLVLRLRSVLGRRDGHEGNYRDPFREEGKRTAKNGGADNVVHLPDRTREERAEELGVDMEASGPETPMETGLAQIQIVDPTFTPDGMLSGARIAFEMVLGAFAAGDRKTLGTLLSSDVMADFEQAIDERERENRTLDLTLVGIRKAEIVEAYMEGDAAYVTIKFVSEQIPVERDAEGEIVEGDPNRVADVTDFWTFSRDTRSRNPNWSLVATQSLE